jgi:hypothetical protein
VAIPTVTNLLRVIAAIASPTLDEGHAFSRFARFA